VLSRLAVLKGAPFFWIKDLTQPDKLMILPVTLPIFSNELNLLPIIMAIGMFLQQRLSGAAAGTGSSEQQKMMLVLMPIMFGVIFYRMPSGLVLYWLVNSILMLISQVRMQRAQ
jgi:YidC/Oxa1 family membrane protein insertase